MKTSEGIRASGNAGQVHCLAKLSTGTLTIIISPLHWPLLTLLPSSTVGLHWSKVVSVNHILHLAE